MSLKRPLTIALLALAHFGASLACTLARFNSAVYLYATGASPSIGDVLLDRCQKLLQFPLVPVAQWAPPDAFPGLFGWIPFAMNSLLWACAIVWVGQWSRERLAVAAEPEITPLPPDAPPA